jgi:rubrerythrin
MTTKSELAILSQALKLEKQGRAFYLKAADATLDAKGQIMFRSLADDERRHVEMVERQLHALQGDGAWVPLPDLKVTPIDLGKELFPPKRQQVADRVGANPSEIDALHVALDNEIKSYDLYRKAAGEISDAAGKRLCEWLAGAEMVHFNLLMSNYQAMVDRGGWA